MRTGILLHLLLCFSAWASAQTTISLNDGWTVYQQGRNEQIKAGVPGCVQADLLRSGKIPDPFKGLNEDKIVWVGEAGWTYKKTLTIPATLAKKDHLELVFEGLDTYASVYLNGRMLLQTDNMFRRYVVSVKQFIKTGANELTVYFEPVTSRGLQLARSSSIRYPADNEKGDVKISPFIRKAAFQFGWDFAPKLLTVGIWKPVSLVYWDEVAISDARIVVKQFNPKRAACVAEAEVIANKPGNFKFTIINKDDGKVLWNTTRNLSKGLNRIKQEFTLPQPKLWWPNGLGRQEMHRLEIKLTSPEKINYARTVKFGVRSIEVVNKPDSIGESFYVTVNQKPVFIKGANFVPVSSLNRAENKRRLELLFADMVKSHFNMVRVWGGGYYESEEFYELADRYGIMVWQDFPFACTMYPSDAAFLSNVREEAIENIKRISKHPSLALWCGNNEVAVGWQNWGWQKSYGYTTADSLELISGYNKLFRKLLPELVEQYDEGRFYFHSSPISNWGKAEDFKYGDNHYWGVYHGEAPFEAYKTHVPRFNSEFGFQSFPSWSTLQWISDSPEPALTSPVLTNRQRSYKGNQLLFKYMDWYYNRPATDEETVYVSQLQQAEGMKIAIEAARRSMPYNMGTLMWQLNDTWPAISWSAINYDGEWKAAQYFIRKAYAPILLTLEMSDRSLRCTVVPETGDFNAIVVIRKWNVTGGGTVVATLPVTIQPGQVTDMEISPDKLGTLDASTMFLTAELVANGQTIAESIHYLAPVKALQLPPARLSRSVELINGKAFIVLKSNVLCKNVALTVPGSAVNFEDNYFDMLPGRAYRIAVDANFSRSFLEQHLKIMSISQISFGD